MRPTKGIWNWKEYIGIRNTEKADKETEKIQRLVTADSCYLPLQRWKDIATLQPRNRGHLRQDLGPWERRWAAAGKQRSCYCQRYVFFPKRVRGKTHFFFFSNPVPLSNRSYLETAGQMRKIIYKGQSPSETAQSREQIGKQTDKQMANRSNHLGVRALTMDFCFPIH